jgi:hypothetical protein
MERKKRMSDKIRFVTAENETVELYVLEETKVNGVNYLLVTDSQEDEAECYIFKDMSEAAQEEACYVEVEDDNELEAVLKIFEELMDDEADIIK